jgi:hypothetical protein
MSLHTTVEQRRRLTAFVALVLIAFGSSIALAASKSATTVEVPRHPSATGNLTNLPLQHETRSMEAVAQGGASVRWV